MLYYEEQQQYCSIGLKDPSSKISNQSSKPFHTSSSTTGTTATEAERKIQASDKTKDFPLSSPSLSLSYTFKPVAILVYTSIWIVITKSEGNHIFQYKFLYPYRICRIGEKILVDPESVCSKVCVLA